MGSRCPLIRVPDREETVGPPDFCAGDNDHELTDYSCNDRHHDGSSDDDEWKGDRQYVTSDKSKNSSSNSSEQRKIQRKTTSILEATVVEAQLQ